MRAIFIWFREIWWKVHLDFCASWKFFKPININLWDAEQSQFQQILPLELSAVHA